LQQQVPSLRLLVQWVPQPPQLEQLPLQEQPVPLVLQAELQEPQALRRELALALR